MGTTADKLARFNETKVSMKTAINDPALGDRFADYPVAITDGKAYIAQKITEKGVAASGSDTFQQLGDKVGEISGTKSFTITDIGTSTGFPPQANPGEIVEFESGSRFMTNDVKDELSNDIPVGKKAGSFPRYTLYYFVMPNSNVTVNFS